MIKGDSDMNALVPQEYFGAFCFVPNYKFCRTGGGYVGLTPTSVRKGTIFVLLLDALFHLCSVIAVRACFGWLVVATSTA
jgi:hypothetical protein